MQSIKPVSDCVSYEDAKIYLRDAITHASSVDSYENIQEVERWDTFIRNHPKYVIEQQHAENEWRKENVSKNLEALKTQQKCVPSDIFSGASVDSLVSKGVYPSLAVRLMRNRALWLVHMESSDIALTHIADLKFKYSYAGLDVIEMRALYAYVCQKNFKMTIQKKKQNG